MRRLPIFFLLDVSESMVGEKLAKLEEGLSLVVRELRSDPHALETVYLSVVAFAGAARTVTQLTELGEFNAPELPLGGGTALGRALDHLMREMDRTVARSTPDRKGDWQPLVFLMTDGKPTDDPGQAILRWNAGWGRKASMVAISIGADADLAALVRLTGNVLAFESAQAADITKVVKWISQSIQSRSRSVGTEGPPPMEGITDAGMRRVSLAKDGEVPAPKVDDRHAVIIGQCATRKLPYLMKFDRGAHDIGIRDHELGQLFHADRYMLADVYPLRKSFFEMSGPDGGTPTIDANLLVGSPPCPHCVAKIGFAICSCGGAHCIEGPGERTCPWCGKLGSYAIAQADDEITVNRGKG
ncbi:hypothetical protein IP70_11170 [alpha proteobacterium AAP38]|nr:hypothetical protein IP70_11170 [alpha proteobacterium AAP38]